MGGEMRISEEVVQALLDSQEPGRNEAEQRHRNLWAAVLARAVVDASGTALDTMGRCNNPDYAQSWQRSARKWIDEENHKAPGFDWICMTLDLDPRIVRQELYRQGLPTMLPAKEPEAA